MSLIHTELNAKVRSFSAVVITNGTLVLNEEFPHASARRDAVVEVALAQHPGVDRAEIREILAPYGGANADHALGVVVDLFKSRGAQLDVHLVEVEREPEPVSVFGAFTSYGDGDVACVIYPTAEARQEGLRNQVEHFYEDPDGNPLPPDVSEENLVKILETAYLLPTEGRIHLFEAVRDGDGNFRF